MKYPQLVSNRAINEISDWLITRLEELDIEQPGVYSRLLLSLLQTSFKVDSAELLDILQLKDTEKPHKLLRKSNEELQRLAAVESLVEVSAEENKSKIINLVNELHSKLRQVEDSSHDDSPATIVEKKQQPAPSNLSKKLKKVSKRKDVIGVGTEPDRNYYDVFPALSAHEKLTRAAVTAAGPTIVSEGHARGAEQARPLVKLSKSQLCWSALMSDSSVKLVEGAGGAGSGVGGAKKPRKKARRSGGGKLLNQKITDVQYSSNNAKCYDGHHNATFLPKSSKSNTKKHQRNCLVSSKYPKASVVAHRGCKNNSSSTATSENSTKAKKSTERSAAPWDMDFRDHWEMDQDLISEFLLQQRRKKECELELARHPYEEEEEADTDDNDPQDATEDDTMLKCLPERLFHDDDDDECSEHSGEGDDARDGDEGTDDERNKDSLTVMKMRFDANVKALWNDADESAAAQFECNNNSSSYVNDSSSAAALSLFNFSNQLRSLGVITPSDPHFYIFNKKSSTCNSSGANSTFVPDRQQQPVQHQSLQPSGSSSLISPSSAGDRFIKLGTNLHSSIWSDCEQAQDDENGVDQRIDPDDDLEAELKLHDEPSDDADDAEVSLFNHSDASAFKRFKPTTTIVRASYHPINKAKTADNAVSTLMASSFEGENLLTSESTHFSPIICDGHNFVINNDWNKIKYERSPSGAGLLYSGKRYQQWTLPITSVVEAAACSALDLDAMENEESPAMRRRGSDFTIKFQVLGENEKGCQTDMSDFIRLGSQGLMEINEKYLKRNVFADYGYSMGYSDNTMWQYHQEESNDYTMMGQQQLRSPVELYEDPYESWNNLKPDQLQNDHLRMMKDELRVDCDEIMSVIQNLYITGGDVCGEDEDAEAADDFEDMDHFYTDMLDESGDGFEDYKFYEGGGDGSRSKIDERFTPNLIEEHQQFENFSDITRWSWSEDFTKDQEKYLNLLKWIQTTIFKESRSADDNNNNHQHDAEQRKSSNRKRRHSTCQNYHGTTSSSPKLSLIEDQNCNNLFGDSAKLLKVNIERSRLMPGGDGKRRDDHYRNILQQHILIKQMEHTRPLTR